jgi:hypothetical protein
MAKRHSTPTLQINIPSLSTQMTPTSPKHSSIKTECTISLVRTQGPSIQPMQPTSPLSIQEHSDKVRSSWISDSQCLSCKLAQCNKILTRLRCTWHSNNSCSRKLWCTRGTLHLPSKCIILWCPCNRVTSRAWSFPRTTSSSSCSPKKTSNSHLCNHSFTSRIHMSSQCLREYLILLDKWMLDSKWTSTIGSNCNNSNNSNKFHLNTNNCSNSCRTNSRQTLTRIYSSVLRKSCFSNNSKSNKD